MKKLIACASLAVSTMLGASLPAIPSSELHGSYVEARTADVYTGPCFANSEVDLVGNLAVFGWKIDKGSWQGTSLDGLSVVGVVRASTTLGNDHATSNPAKALLIVDERATPSQRLALKSFAQKMGGGLLKDVVAIDSAPIEFTFEGGNIHMAKAKLTAGTLANIETRALNHGDDHCTNEETWYRPLSKLDHAMPAYAIAHSFTGKELGTTWSSPDKRSAFVGSFSVQQ
jgi:hypothetical protein